MNISGPYYDTFSRNIRITDPKILEYAKLSRKVDVGLRVSVKSQNNRLIIRPKYKTYFIDRGILGYEDTRIPILSTSSYSDFPAEFIDDNLAKALNWASGTKYRIDNDFYDFIDNLLYFKDDKGKAEYFDGLNEYRHYIGSRGDAYERFKAMEWLRKDNSAFSNHVFIDHRARVYERGLIGPQSGESFRPFLNTEAEEVLGVDGFYNFKDQVGSFLGGMSDEFEGNYNGLSMTGRQKIADKWWPDLVEIGNLMLRNKPNDIRKILENPIVASVDGEELGKFYRLALESAKIDRYLKDGLQDINKAYYKENLKRLDSYKTALALEQDASASGAQIIALTTKNKQLAELSNVIPGDSKKRIYDIVSRLTFNDPRFKKLNERLGLREKDLVKASKYQVMVSLYGAGERTGILQVETRLAKALGKQENLLVVNSTDRQTVLGEIDARIAKFAQFDPETALELKILRQDVRDVFNKGLDPGDEIMDQLYFLDPKTRELVERMTRHYDNTITPGDFKAIANIMTEYMGEQVPILKTFTRFHGRLAEDFLKNSKPSKADFDWLEIAKIPLMGKKEATFKKHRPNYKSVGWKLHPRISEFLGLAADESITDKLLKRYDLWERDGTLYDLIFGTAAPLSRRTGASYFKTEFSYPTLDWKNKAFGAEKKLTEFKLFWANKLPKSWVNVPSVNFDGKIIEQNFTQTFEERLRYKDQDGKWIVNILQVPQKTESSWWEQMINKQGKINDIADATHARTAYGVNANHSNDATIVKRFHMWGADNNVPTSSVHDAFVSNAGLMLKARKALRKIYADSLERNVIKLTLDEMLARGLPKEIYQKYLDEAIDTGLIPVPGRSRVDGKLLKDTDILLREDILREIPESFFQDFGFYGIG